MVVVVSREPIDSVNDQVMDSPFVLPTVFQKFLKLSSLGRLCRFSFIDESSVDLETLTLAVLLARLPLRGEAQVLRLLLG